MTERWTSDGEPERVVVAASKSPESIRKVVADECAGMGEQLAAELDIVLMGGADLAQETTMTLPGGLKIMLRVELKLVDDGADRG